MKLGDLTELASQNLREALLRNSLTTLGIAVGVASLVAMLSLGVGLQDLINRRLESNGLFNTVLVRPQRRSTPMANAAQPRFRRTAAGMAAELPAASAIPRSFPSLWTQPPASNSRSCPT